MWSINILILTMTLGSTLSSNSGWNSAPNTQYHIQTDEGPERFFRYQTTSGQYRKEKRLQDGTVIGTSGWVDPNGYLRLQDYIADTKGYRILKSKMVFVGNAPIQDAVTASKSIPASNGILVSPKPVTPRPTPSYVRYTPTTPSPVYLPNSIETNTKRPVVEIKPHGDFGSNQIATVTPSTFTPIDSSEQSIPSSSPSSTYLPPSSYPSSTYLPPSSSYLPPTSTYSPIPSIPSTLLPPLSTPDESLPVLINHKRPYTSGPNYEHPWAYEVGGKPKESNHIGDGYTPQFPPYDGVSVTRNGFRYYLPRQYHEEETSNNNDRTGSFGYIDPFGIRRVVYYNAGEGKGFQHRKNNRYVGFNATPYDPRPY